MFHDSKESKNSKTSKDRRLTKKSLFDGFDSFEAFELQKESCNGRRNEVRERSRQHRAQAEAREIVTAGGRAGGRGAHVGGEAAGNCESAQHTKHDREGGEGGRRPPSRPRAA